MSSTNHPSNSSHLTTNEHTAKDISFNLESVIVAIKKAWIKEAEAKSIRINIYTDSEIPDRLYGNTSILTQVLNNLLSNAIKFTQTGSITIETTVEETTPASLKIRLEIRDTGVGMSKEQISAAINYSPTNSEISLAATQRLLKQHNSFLDITSTPAKGTSVTFEIKFNKSEFIATAVPASLLSTETVKALVGSKLLLVEEDEVNRTVVSRFLKSWGVQLDYARNGKEALEKVQFNTYDLILMDLQTPEMDSYQTTQAIRNFSEKQLASIPIIAFTTTIVEDVRTKAARAGMSDFITKPFDPVDLYACIEKLLAQRKEEATANQTDPDIVPPTTAPTPTKSLRVLQKVTEVSEDDLNLQESLFTLAVQSLEQLKVDYPVFMREHNLNDLKFMVHKMKTLFSILELEELESEVSRGIQLLSNKATAEEYEASIATVDQLCDFMLS
jgi:CheY-like chemotaxis protein